MTTRLRTNAELMQASGLMDAVCERGNLWLAYDRVAKNKGAAGVDGIGVTGFKDHLKQATLAGDQGQPAGGELHSLAGTPGGHSEAARWDENPRHSDADGSVGARLLLGSVLGVISHVLHFLGAGSRRVGSALSRVGRGSGSSIAGGSGGVARGIRGVSGGIGRRRGGVLCLFHGGGRSLFRFLTGGEGKCGEKCDE